MNNDAPIPCPAGLVDDDWETLLADLARAISRNPCHIQITDDEAIHVLKALRFYAEHGGEIVERDQLRAVCEAFLARYQNKLVDARLMFSDIAYQARAALDAAPEPRVKPWRNPYVLPEGVAQEEWDRRIKGAELDAINGDPLARHALAHLPRVPEEWPIRRFIKGSDIKHGDYTYVVVLHEAGSVSVRMEHGPNHWYGRMFPAQIARAVASAIVDVMDEYERRTG